jgi:hypothetical protein
VSRPPRARTELWLVGALTLAAAALRFSTLDLQSFWHDEAVTVGRVLDPSLFTTLDRVPGSEATPPLYYALAWVWAKLFGSGEIGIRSLSALAGTATVPVAWWAGRALAGRAAGIGAAALVAFSPYLVWYSQEARAYALLVLLCALSLAYFARALAAGQDTGAEASAEGARSKSASLEASDPSSRSRSDLALWAISSALALLTHYFAVFVVGPELVLLAWLLPERRRAVAWAGAAVVAVGLALVPLAVHQADRGHDGWIAQIQLGTRVKDTGEQFLLGYSGSPARALSALTAVLAAAVAAIALWRGREQRGLRIAAVVAAAALAVPLVAKLAGADYVYPRNMIGAWVPLAVVAGAAAASRLGAVALAALCATFIALTVAVDVDTKLQRADWRGAARALGPARVPRAIVVPAIGDDPLAYYARAARLPRGTATVPELDVVGFGAAPRPSGRRVPAGFEQVERRRSGAFTIVRYRAAAARRIGRPELARARLGTGHAAVLVQVP